MLTLSAASGCWTRLVAPPVWRGQLRYAVPSLAGWVAPSILSGALTPGPWPGTTSHGYVKETCMADKTKLCMISGTREAETSSICPMCAESVKREAMGQHSTLKRHGENESR